MMRSNTKYTPLLSKVRQSQSTYNSAKLLQGTASLTKKKPATEKKNEPKVDSEDKTRSIQVSRTEETKEVDDSQDAAA